MNLISVPFTDGETKSSEVKELPPDHRRAACGMAVIFTLIPQAIVLVLGTKTGSQLLGAVGCT